MAPSIASVPVAGDVGVSTVEKRLSSCAEADRYFASIITRLKCVEGEDFLVPRWLTISGSSPFWTEGALSGEYLRGALHPTLAKQVYECSSEELMNRVGKSTVWGLHFVSALIDQVHDAGRLVRSQHEKILALRAANKELKASVGQELVATVERRVKELEAKIKRMQTELESLRSQRREFEQKGNVLSLTKATTFLEAELKAEGQKAVATYKASRVFESGLEKMGRVGFEFGYWVAGRLRVRVLGGARATSREAPGRRSYIPVFQIRIEKMEVKRPPL
ncbi:hypothetical protein B296_00048788 [Ensete ventricosum]|uniref:Uncharacterized protein n=1 Tax=Ensete ventricosum TaxID=4639 RepID=A0A426YDU5_ENSVE|nr:hypothetical protein B296_00048788 [Ensete ventricosum]